MDEQLAEASRKLCADSLFDLVRTNYNKANAEYLQKQLQIASKYLTLEQRKELTQKGIFIVT